MQNSLILASGSPRRRELLSLMGITYQICPADVDEHMTGAPGRGCHGAVSPQGAGSS